MSSYIRQIQTTLKKAGLYTGEIDGLAGKLTVEAVNKATANEILEAEAKRAVAEQAKSIPEYNPIQNVDTATVKASGFVLSDRSLKNLQGVNPNLVKVVKRAIQISNTDFAVIEGLRTKERQRELVRKGASKTMNSRHLTGHAVDIVPIVNGQISWDFNHYYPLAKAMAQAGTPQDWVKEYRAGGGRFLDGPHFELPA